MGKQGCFRIMSYLFLLCLSGLVACGDANSMAMPGNTAQANVLLQKPLPTDRAIASQQPGVVQLTLAGAENGHFLLQGDGITSKLRHGHLEFTIFLVEGARSFFIAFHGYTGPQAYTLQSVTNGGDLHIAQGNGQPTWDLSLHQTATCQLLVESEVPTDVVDIHRMKGKFSCPALFSGDSGFTLKTVAVRQGSFDISIIVES
ncbi:MAG TPA: hypothetical protein VL485_15855 [Ktedonobacteraceae bacterium]|jgi:hypothetical protein|nr:hypothetical protein [Ktedonobacteraceae bacterium]